MVQGNARMLVLRTLAELRKRLAGWRADGARIGFVPTMGALHDGHLSLVDIARAHADRVIVSIFVNPTQFAPHEDFAAYPRDEAGDLTKLEHVDAVWLPAVSDLYPQGAVSDIKAGPAAQGLESAIRPHFFDGVLSVVSRLFDHVKPDVAVFGEKDYQQLSVIREFVHEKNLPIDILGGPVMRDAQGLALSSRNAYLTDDQKKIARRLNVILFGAAAALRAGDDSATVISGATAALRAAGFDAVQYLARRDARLLAAVRLGALRLIDNVAV